VNTGDAERTNALEKANEDLKAAQAELQRRWQYLAEAQRLSHSGTFGWKVNSGELVWSDETYRILGFTRGTHPTLDLVFERAHPDDRERLQQLRDRAAQNGMDLEVEHRILLPDGVIKHVHVVAHAGRENSGNLEYMGVVTDITERKRADQERQALSRELEESKARLEEGQRVAHMGHYQMDLIANRVTWSDELCRIYGLRPQKEPIDMAMVWERVHPEDRERISQAVEEAIRGGTHFELEHRIVRSDGDVRTVQAFGTVKRDASGRAYELFGTGQDITEHKRADEERQALSRSLQESNAWLEEAQRVAHIGYWVWDLETNTVIYSEENYHIFGLTPEKGPVDIATVRERIFPEDREYVFRTADEAIRSGRRADCEHRIVRPNGEIRTIHSLGDLKKDASGRPYQMFGTTQDITERKRAEEKIKNSEARLRQVIDTIPTLAWCNLADGPNEFLNKRWHEFTGLSPEESHGWGWQVAFHPDDIPPMMEKWRELLASGEPGEMEARLRRHDGVFRWFLVRVEPLRDETGSILRWYGTSTDIESLKQIEEKLREDERELRRSRFYLSEGERLAHMGSWASSDLGTRWSDDLGIYWSDEVYKIYGLDPKSGPPNIEQYLALVHPHDRASMSATLKAMHEQRCGCDLTKRIVRPDGEVRYVRCVGIPVVEEGLFKGFHGTTMDVTEHELLTQELRREQAYLAEAQRLTHAGSWGVNLVKRQVFHSSDENNRLYGFDVSEYPNPFDLHYSSILAEDEPALTKKLENAIRAGADFDVEYRIRRADGAIRVLRGIGHHNPAQEFGEYFGITMDITDQKHAEKEREKLRQLEADLAHINRVNMMGELAAALAHEIKQPIAASIINANALRRWLAHEPPDLERARATAVGIEENANRAADVINSLQSFYKRETPVKRQIVAVKNIVEEMAVLLQTEAARRLVAIRTEITDDTPTILVDRVQLQQIFMNLMLNAIEAMKDSGGDLTIKSGVNPEGWLLVSISDTGVGLPEDWTEKMFDPFQTTKSQGTGMGLSITRSIVESYGGRVWATGNQGPGATFHFTLPRELEVHA
jgi:PAS domain S-box-containing protein